MSEGGGPVTVRTEGGRLTVQASAGCAPVIGVFFLVISGIFIYGLSGAFVNLSDVSLPERAVAWMLALAGVSAGLWILHTTRAHRVTFDPVRRVVRIDRRAPFHTARQELRMAEVRRAVVSKHTDPDGDAAYGAGLELVDGRSVSLAPQLYPDRAACEAVVAEVNRFLEAQR